MDALNMNWHDFVIFYITLHAHRCQQGEKGPMNLNLDRFAETVVMKRKCGRGDEDTRVVDLDITLNLRKT